MTIHFEQSLQDIYDWMEHQRSKRKQEYPLRAIITLVIIGYGFLQRGQNALAWILIAVAISLAAGPLLQPWQRATWRRRLEMSEKATEQVPEELRQKKTVTLEQGGLRVTEPNAKREVLHYWDGLTELIELERLVVVRIGKLGMETILIPRRAFAAPDQYSAFVAELRGKLPVGEAEETPSGES
jgi:hypothetical protein